MRLIYDHGTIVIEDPDEALAAMRIPHLVWDTRVAKFRLPGQKYGSLVVSLNRAGIPFEDQIYRSGVAPKQWRTPELRPYQQAALTAWDCADQRGVVVLPTGAGKTRVAMAAMAKTGLATLCMVPTRVLLEQWQKQLASHYDGEIGIYGDGERRIAPITIATFESAYRHMALLGNHFRLLVIDEVHHFETGIRSEILEMSPAASRLGLSATLGTRSDVISSLPDLVGPVVYELDIDALRGSFLADFDLYSMHIDLNPSERFTYEVEMALYRKQLMAFKRICPEASWPDFARHCGQTAEGRRALAALRAARKLIAFPEAKRNILASLLSRHAESRVLIFTGDTDTAYQIAREHLIMPLTADIHRKERDEMLGFFRDGLIRAIVSCRVLNEGLDVPDAEVAIILGGAQGVREHVQRIGRLLRPAPGKRAIIYELVCRRTLEVRQSQRRNETLDS